MSFVISMEKFLNEPGVTEVKIPNGVTEIKHWAIPDGITSVVIPKSVTKIDENSFLCAGDLLSITVDPGNPVYCDIDGVLYSKDKTVLVWYPLGRLDKEFIFPDHITKICDLNVRFYVTSVVIPKGVTEIESQAFIAADDLLSITVSPDNPVYCDIDGVLYSKDKTVLVCYPRGRQDAEFIIPDHVTKISDFAFAGCHELSSIILHDHVTTIGNGAFASSGLSSIKLPNSLKSIANGAFASCSLTSIKFPDSLKSIGSEAFSHCEGLTSVIIPDGITEIHDWTFSSCKNLTSVRIPRSVTAIHRYAFNECHFLTSVEIPDSVTKIDDGAFRWCERVTILTTPGSYADDYAQKKGLRVSYIPLEE